MAACDSDAMVNSQYPFKGQQVLTLIGSEQTTSSLVVMIVTSTSSAIGIGAARPRQNEGDSSEYGSDCGNDIMNPAINWKLSR